MTNAKDTFTRVCLVLLALTALGLWASPPIAAQAPTGLIAYVRSSTFKELRAIQSDSSNDHTIWTEPRPDLHYVINSALTWRPDGSEITFASNHEEACSIYESDVFAIHADGSGLRRVTLPPSCNALGSYQKGMVVVHVQNSSSSSGVFFVYVEGAPSILPITLAGGGSGSVTFNNVAAFPGHLQAVVAIQGLTRWFDPAAAVTVQPGSSVNSSLTLFGEGFRQFGYYGPAWRKDGSVVGSILGGCGGTLDETPANAPAGTFATRVLNTTSAAFCSYDWGPTPTLADQILYDGGALQPGIYRVREGSNDAGTPLVQVDSGDVVYRVEWLPDGSGFLFSKRHTDFFNGTDNANLFAYNFATQQVTQITQFTNEFFGDFDLSSDGQSVVFERYATLGAGAVGDLWTMRRDGSDMRLLVHDGAVPAWQPTVTARPHKAWLPLSVRKRH